MPWTKKPTTEMLHRFRVTPGTPAGLAGRDPGWAGDDEVPKKDRKDAAEDVLADGIERLRDAQELLWASDSRALLVVFQALDAAGKDSAIKHVFSGVNPQGCRVAAFKQPSAEELDHDFLWRCSRELPRRGQIGIFNRSYYEEVLVVRVHPSWLGAQRLPGLEPGAVPPAAFWQQRYESINDFEQHLERNGTRVVKFFLHLSPEEQRQRFLDRLDEPDKQWKFSTGDLAERARWDDYQAAYEEAITATSSEWAPWYVLPADHKWVTRALVVEVLCRQIAELGLSFPAVADDDRAKLAEARRSLEAEAPPGEEG